MKTLVVIATGTELAGVFAHFKLPEKKFTQTVNFDILITGVGMTATAFALGQHLNGQYNCVLNLGIAGSFSKDIALGSLVNIVEDEFAELGAENNDDFLSIEALGFGKSKYSSDYGTKRQDLEDLPEVKGITVNKVHGNLKSILKIKERSAPVTESMEGAAVFYCCSEMQVACLQIRAISNYVEPRNKDNWRIGLAIKKLNDWAIRFLENNSSTR